MRSHQILKRDQGVQSDPLKAQHGYMTMIIYADISCNRIDLDRFRSYLIVVWVYRPHDTNVRNNLPTLRTWYVWSFNTNLNHH